MQVEIQVQVRNGNHHIVKDLAVNRANGEPIMSRDAAVVVLGSEAVYVQTTLGTINLGQAGPLATEYRARNRHEHYRQRIQTHHHCTIMFCYYQSINRGMTRLLPMAACSTRNCFPYCTE